MTTPTPLAPVWPHRRRLEVFRPTCSMGLCANLLYGALYQPALWGCPHPRGRNQMSFGSFPPQPTPQPSK